MSEIIHNAHELDFNQLYSIIDTSLPEIRIGSDKYYDLCEFVRLMRKFSDLNIVKFNRYGEFKIQISEDGGLDDDEYEEYFDFGRTEYNFGVNSRNDSTLIGAYRRNIHKVGFNTFSAFKEGFEDALHGAKRNRKRIL